MVNNVIMRLLKYTCTRIGVKEKRPLLVYLIMLVAVAAGGCMPAYPPASTEISNGTPANSYNLPGSLPVSTPGISSLCTITIPTSTSTGKPATKPNPPSGAFGELNVSYVSGSGLIVTLNQMFVTAHGSYYDLNIEYTLQNIQTGQALDEEIFKAYFADGTGETETGLFGRLLPGQSISRSYVWRATWNNTISLIEFEPNLNSSTPDPGTLKWKPPTS
jgi:hypothetical protein